MKATMKRLTDGAARLAVVSSLVAVPCGGKEAA